MNKFNGTIEEFNARFNINANSPIPPTGDAVGLIEDKLLFDGAEYKKYVASTNHGNITYHVVTIETSKAEFFVSPQQTARLRVPDYVKTYGLDIAVNGDGFISTAIAGFASSEGKPYGTTGVEETLYISRENKFTHLRPSSSLLWNAISYPNRLVEGGVLANITRTDLDPRTAMGYSKDGSKFIMVCVDGKETYSTSRTGMSFTEVGNILIEHGAYWGAMLDGGGSSTMAVRQSFGNPLILNTPCGEDYIAEYDLSMRRVANVIGVRMNSEPLGIPIEVSVPIITGEINNMNYKIIIQCKPRKTPSMYELITLPNLTVGSEFQSVGSSYTVNDTSRVDNGVTFVQMPNLYWIPLLYKGIQYAQEIVSTPVPSAGTIIERVFRIDTSTGKVSIDGGVWQ